MTNDLVPPIQISNAKSSHSIVLPTSRKLDEWREWADGPGNGSGGAPMDWFLAFAAQARKTAHDETGTKVNMAELGRLVGVVPPRVVTDGAYIKKYTQLIDALGARALRGAIVDGTNAAFRLAHQARMATFLRYRDGLSRYLRDVALTPEAAVHAYVRLVTEWAWQWRGLAVATTFDFDERVKTDAARPRSSEEQRLDRMAARAGIPLIVRWDLRSLLELERDEAKNIGRARNAEGIVLDVAVDTLMYQLSCALGMMADDESLAALSAANVARAYANESLGGALARLRISQRAEDFMTVLLLEEVRRHFLQPMPDDPSEEDTRRQAEDAKSFRQLRIALQAFGHLSKETNA